MHTQLFYDICHKNNIMCPILEYYIKYQDDVIADIPDGKTEFLASVNKNTLNKKIKNKFLKILIKK